MSHELIDTAEALRRFNARFFMSSHRGKFQVYRETRSRSTRRLELVPMSARDFCDAHAHLVVDVGDTKPKPAGRWWIEHRDARRFDEIVFDPDPNSLARAGADGEGLAAPGVYNTFRGFATHPRQGTWERISAHFRNVLANGDDVLYEFILDWFAFLFQRPHVPPGICLAFMGVPGSGKTTIGKLLEKMIGPQHYLPVSQASQIVGRFNGHLEDRIVLFSDEAFWAGDKQGEAALKTLITEPTLTIENKFGRIERARNCIHLIMATNLDWIAPVGLRDRRFVVMRTSDKYAQDPSYFDPLYAEIDGDGLAAFMFDMKRRVIPDRLHKPKDSYVAADAANEQVRHSFDHFMTWLDERLSTGVLARKGAEADWPVEIEKSVLYDDYLREMREIGAKHILNEGRFARRLLLELPDFTNGARRSVQGTTRRARTWTVPPLEVCRMRFEARVGTMGFYAASDKHIDDLLPT